jgi:hypothetical protein
MNNVFSLNYPEFVTAEELAKALPKDKYSVFIPLSRQQKALDLLVSNLRTGRSASVQVKGSRSWGPHKEYDRLLWFNTFKVPRYGADFYALVGIYHGGDMRRWMMIRAGRLRAFGSALEQSSRIRSQPGSAQL